MQSISPGIVDTEFVHNVKRDSEAGGALMDGFASFPNLTSQDIADAVLYVVGAPAHVSIHELTIMPTEQPAPA